MCSKTQGQLSECLLDFSNQNDLSESQMKEFYKVFSSTYEEELSATGYVAPTFCSKVFDAAVKTVYNQTDDCFKSLRILDVGAGTGMLGELLKELGYTNVDAIDCSDDMLKKAKEKNVYQKIMVKFVDEKKNEEIKDGEYDGIVSSGAISAPQIQARAFDEMLRWLKNGGLFGFTIRTADFEMESLGYKTKLVRFEEESKWKLITKELVDYFDNVGNSVILKKALMFVYQKL